MRLDPQECMIEWMESKFLRGDTDETLAKDRRIIGYFFEFLARENITDLRAVTPELLLKHSRELHAARSKNTGEPLLIQTITGRLVTIRTFFRYLTRRGLMLRDLARTILLPQKTRFLPKTPFTETEIERILSLPDTETVRGIRDRAILEVLYSTGIRRAELAKLTLADVQDETIFISQGKGNKDRMVPCGARAMDWIQKYLMDARPDLVRGNCQNLFVNLKGTKFHPEKVSEIVRQYKNQAGIKKRGASHLVRHTSATLMLENGADVRHIQEFLGHESVDTTRIYTHLSAARLQKELSDFHPGERSSVSLKSSKRNRTKLMKSRNPRKRKGDRPFPEVFLAIGEEHLTAMRDRGYAVATLRQRRWYLHPFFEWLMNQGIADVTMITTEILMEYGKEVRAHKQKNGEPYSARSLYRHMVIVFLFTRWLFEIGRLMYDPAVPLDRPQCPQTLPRAVLSAREAALILSRPDTETLYGMRDRAIMELLYAAGLRRAELAGLKLKDFDFEKETLRVYSSKTRGERVIPAGKHGSIWTQKYIEKVRPELDREVTDFLFLGDHGRGLDPQWISGIVMKYMKMAGLKKSDPGHIFRRTFATLMLENGASLRTVQELLGHMALRTTQVYTRVTIRKLREVHKRTHPAERDPALNAGIQPQKSKPVDVMRPSKSRAEGA